MPDKGTRNATELTVTPAHFESATVHARCSGSVVVANAGFGMRTFSRGLGGKKMGVLSTVIDAILQFLHQASWSSIELPLPANRAALAIAISAWLLMAPTYAQEPTRIGNWFVLTRSQLDDTTTFAAGLKSTNQVATSTRTMEEAQIFVQCRSGKLSAYVDWPSFMGSARQIVRWKFDREKIAIDFWEASRDGTATFNPSPLEFLRGLRSAKMLVVEAPPLEGAPVEAIFDVSGSNVIATNAMLACGVTP
jgi:hypothetical protein